MEIDTRVSRELDRHLSEERSDLDFKYKRLRNFFQLCESPLEQKFLFYVLDFNPHRFFNTTTGYDPALYCPALMCNHWDIEEFHDFAVKIIAQYKPTGQEGRCRTDFLFELMRNNYIGETGEITSRAEVFARLIVEVDGHDFHERTKEQAMRDKSRDRFMAVNGYTVFRFTGSEVHRNPFRVANEIEEFLAGIMKRAEAGEISPLDYTKSGLMSDVNLNTRFFSKPFGRKNIYGC